MPLFDANIPTIGDRPRQYAEPVFDYYNASGRKDISAARKVLDQWHGRFPEEPGAELRARFRSRNERQHNGAFFELFLHELFSRLGYEAGVHPDIDESTHPDFVLKRAGEARLYLEATIAAESDEEAGQQKLVDQVYDSLNRLRNPDFLLALRVQGAPMSAPPGRRLREKIERWLDTLEWRTVKEAWDAGGFDGLPTYPCEHDGWSLLIQPIPKADEQRGSPDVRPIGLHMPSGVFPVTVDEDIKRAVQVKNKYGELDLPFLVAINVTGDFCSQYDVMNALFGHETVVFGPNGTRAGERLHDGAWDGPKGPQNTTISAVMVFRQLNIWNVSDREPWIVHNPWARWPLGADDLPFTQWVPRAETGELVKTEGRAPGLFLELPEPWPPEDSD